MATASPAVSVLMPVYNAGRFLAPALESILSQTFSDFELIAMDDGSRDASGEVLARLAARDSRVRVFTQENQGIVATLNRALELARAPLVARMDADDLSRPDRFARQFAFLRAHPEIAVVSSAVDMIDEDGAYLRTEAYPTLPVAIESELAHRSCVCHAGSMSRTAVLRSVGGYRRPTQYAEDYDLFLRISEVARIANLPDALYSIRLHPVTISARHLVAQELAVLAVRGAARMRRSGRPDPLAADPVSPASYPSVRRMLAGSVPRAELAFSFFRAVLARTAQRDSIIEWSKLYLRHGLWELDGEGATTIMLLLGRTMLQQRRSGVAWRAQAHCIVCGLATAARHPIAALRIALDVRNWVSLFRAGLLRPATPRV